MKNNLETAGTFKDGQVHLVRLQFLYDFMRLSGITILKVAELTGLTRQSVYHWFDRDDMKLSQLHRVLELCGCRLTLSLDMEIPQEKSFVVVNMSLPNPDSSRRLGFLKMAMDRYDISRDRLAGLLGVGTSTVSRWLTSDDCFISYIFSSAELLGLKLTIDIVPL